jgi:ubiquinone/menaquinone biosynthesis C-methylase UbiE
VQAANFPDKSLTECLEILRRSFDIEAIAARRIDELAVVEYYRQSDSAYRLLHSNDGALHLALNQDGRFDREGYHAQPDFVARHLDEAGAMQILEAGSGNGFNTLYLAKLHPQRQFLGVDLTAEHVAAAQPAADGMPNLKYLHGNYQSLPLRGESLDLAFGVETFCQATDLRAALSEMRRVLRPGGRLLVVDCFRRRSLDELSPDLQLAARLVEKATAVDEFAVIDQWVGLVGSLGFRVLESLDETAFVTGNLERFYRLARGLFEDPALTDALRQTVPPLLLQNAICGLLMPFTVGGGAHGYYSIALERTGGRAAEC